MASPTASDVHVPAAIGKKGKAKDDMMPMGTARGNPQGKAPVARAKAGGKSGAKAGGKSGAKMGQVPPQFLPKQKGQVAKKK